LPAGTAAVVMSNVSRKDEQTLRTTVGDLAGGFDPPKDGPVIILMGAAMDEASMQRPHAARAPLRSEPYFLEA
jgi:uroporphyrin-III C-methyltransferase/precorrin-2 dehydrogenase/sirohydrochlorin ferrochelatase